MTLIHFFFGGGGDEILPLTGRGTKLRPEVPKCRSLRPEGSWGGGSEPPSYQQGCLARGSAVSSSSGVRGGAPGKKIKFWCNLRP